MFHEVKIFDKKGKVKKVLSSEKLSAEYWNSFFNNSLSETMHKGKGRGRKPQKGMDCDDETLEWSNPKTLATELIELNWVDFDY